MPFCKSHVPIFGVYGQKLAINRHFYPQNVQKNHIFKNLYSWEEIFCFMLFRIIRNNQYNCKHPLSLWPNLIELNSIPRHQRCMRTVRTETDPASLLLEALLLITSIRGMYKLLYSSLWGIEVLSIVTSIFNIWILKLVFCILIIQWSS